MKKKLVLLLFATLSLCTWQADGQVIPKKERTTPVFAIKRNVLHDATTCMNLGVEVKVGRKLTMDVPVTWNPWTFSDNKKFKHIIVQPELRHWLCEPFSGHFFGLHAHYAYYNVGGYGSRHMKDYRHEGRLAGGGISYGYVIYLATRLSLEFNIGLGYAYMDYEEWDCRKCGDFRKKNTKHYFGPTRAGITFTIPIF